MQNETKEKLVKILTDELCYCYCDNCINAEEENENACECCYRKYSNWGLAKATAEMLVERIIEVIDSQK